MLNAVRQLTMKLLKRYGIVRLVLFGSRARGNHHVKSDVDLAIFLDTELKDFMAKQDIANDAYDIFLKTYYYIQAHPVDNETNTTIFNT